MIKTVTDNQKCDTTTMIIGKKMFIVKSVFVGDKDVKSTLLKLAERKALREMGIDNLRL
jgi:hypothetical protein